MSDYDKVKELEKKLQETDESIEKQTTECDEQKVVVKEQYLANKALEEQLAEGQDAHHQEAVKQQEMLHKLAQTKIDAVNLKDEWKALKRKIAIDELYAKQPVVWDVMPLRMEHHQASHNSNLVGIDEKDIDIQQVVDNWKTSETTQRPNFSQWHVDFRTMMTQYKEAVKKVCEASVDRREITVDMRQLPNRIIDHWLLQPAQMKVWSK